MGYQSYLIFFNAIELTSINSYRLKNNSSFDYINNQFFVKKKSSLNIKNQDN